MFVVFLSDAGTGMCCTRAVIASDAEAAAQEAVQGCTAGFKADAVYSSQDLVRALFARLA